MPDQHHTDAEKEARRRAIFEKRTSARRRLISRLFDEDADDLAQRLEKCGLDVRLRCGCCNLLKVVKARCDNKWCPNCAPLLAHRAVDRFEPVVAEMHWPLFVTFTCANWEDRVGLRELRRAFTKLRRQVWWKKRVRGGVAQFEVSRMSDVERKRRRLPKRRGMGWHPHCHALLDCRWLSVTTTRPPAGCVRDRWDAAVKLALREVADQWTLCLGRDGSVKVRATFRTDQGDTRPGLRETLKYSVTSDTLEAQDGEIAPLIRELQQTRNLVTWGTLYRNPLLRKRKRDPSMCECGAVGEWMPADLLEAWQLDQERGHTKRKKPSK